MMNTRRKWLDYSEFAAGIELVNDTYSAFNHQLTLEQCLLIASICCVTQKDTVLLSTAENCELALILSYLYNPKYLLVLFQNYDQIELKNVQDYWIKYNEIHNDFITTTPCLIQKSIKVSQIKNTKFNIIIFSSIEKTTQLRVDCTDRFQMIYGNEYDAFVDVLKNSRKLMKEQGILIVFVRACWILPLWELLDANCLQFEYQEFRYYIQDEKNQNRFVWLRFTYIPQGIDVERQKRNLYQFMEDNYIDRLFAHRNNLLFPYHEIAKESSKAYVTMIQNRDNLQYFFSAETTMRLVQLCSGSTACLVVPSVAMCAYDQGKNVVLFEMDNRFRTNGELKFVKYDLYKGLNKLTERKYGKKFNTVICDPPFNIDLDVLARDIYELIINSMHSSIYVVYPKNRGSLLCNAMKKKSMYFDDYDFGIVEYSKPPKLVRQEGIDAIKLFKFIIK